MTADERIEKLLNRFGQTIGDIPMAGDYGYFEKGDRLSGSMRLALDTAVEWYHPEPPDDYEDAMAAYICHLCDVIDRMEAALETAGNVISCNLCTCYKNRECQSFYDCSGSKVMDTELIDDDLAGLYNSFTDKWDDEKLEAILNDSIKTDRIVE